MTRSTVRLAVAVLLAWLVGALGGLAVVPYSMFVFIFVGVMVVLLVVALWERQVGAQPSPQSDEASTTSEPVPWRSRTRPRWWDADDLQAWRRRYRLGWLTAALVVGALVGVFNMFLFAPSVLQLTGEPVHAIRVHVQVTPRLIDPGADVECVLARPDGTRIRGTLYIPEGDVCHETEYVFVDRLGLVDPVRATESLSGSIEAQAIMLSLALLLCVPAARQRPRRWRRYRSR